MYNTYIPVMLKEIDDNNIYNIIETLKKADVNKIFIAIHSSRKRENTEENIAFFNKLKKFVQIFKSNNIIVGIWLLAFDIDFENNFTKITGHTSHMGNCCPSDDNFIKLVSEFLEDLAKTGVDIILLDDDLRLNNLGVGIGCLCKNHIKRISEILNKNVTKEEVERKAFCGKPNKYRSAFLQANREAMLKFADGLRKGVNKANKNVRIGICSCMSVWDLDGADTYEIAEHLAGDTKPFVRLIGAPYWASINFFGNRLADVISLERMEISWRKNKNIETVAEGDTFPRPCYSTPASYLENFELALLADGKQDGILKYAFFDYFNAFYETRYFEEHQRNKLKREYVQNIFKNKEECGLNIIENLKKLQSAVLPEEYIGDEKIENIFFTYASKAANANAVPVKYNNPINSCFMAFGENIRFITEEEMKCGAIIDLWAAKILTERGIDVGIENIGEELSGRPVIFNDGEITNIVGIEPPKYNRLKLNKNCKVLANAFKNGSSYHSFKAEDESPVIYTYENKNGAKFLVLAVMGYYFNNSLFFRNYKTAKIIKDQIKQFNKKPLTATVNNCPDVYVIAKENKESIAVGIFNFSDDTYRDTEVIIGEPFNKIKSSFEPGINMHNGNITVENLPPYSNVFFELEK